MLTKDDKNWIEGKFATKEDLVAANVRLGVEFDKKIDVLREENRSDHDEVMTAFDKVMGEVVKGREHDLVVAHQIERLNKQVFA